MSHPSSSPTGGWGVERGEEVGSDRLPGARAHAHVRARVGVRERSSVRTSALPERARTLADELTLAARAVFGIGSRAWGSVVWGDAVIARSHCFSSAQL
jgi:hypothetical protein